MGPQTQNLWIIFGLGMVLLDHYGVLSYQDTTVRQLMGHGLNRGWFFFFFDSELVSEKVSTLSTEVTSSSPTRFLVLLGAMSKLVSQFSNFILKQKLYSKPYFRL